MRGRKVVFAFIVMMLVAGGAVMYYVPDLDSVLGPDQAQTQLTESPGPTNN